MKKVEIFFSIILVLTDYVMIIAAALAAYFLRFTPMISSIRPVTFDMGFSTYLIWSCWIAFIWIIIFALSGLYAMKGTRKTGDEMRKIFFGTSAAMLVVIVIFFSIHELFFSRFIILVSWLLSFLFVIAARLLVRWIQHRLYYYGIGVHKLVVFGPKERIDELRHICEKEKNGYVVVKDFAHYTNSVKTSMDNLYKKDKFDEVLVLDPDFSKEQVLELIEFCDMYHKTFSFIPDLFNTKASHIQMRMFDTYPVFEIKRTPLEGWGRVYKRLFDIVVSFLAIFLTLPLMILVAICIKVDSKGPVFFSRLDDGEKVKRVGQFGKLFQHIKFRSMYPNQHEKRYTDLAHQNMRKDGPLVKIKNDPRITRVGKFIRRFSLDELPEFFLVFIGKMSLVGPRPHLPEEVNEYKNHQRKVFLVKPGVTGLAQISGRSDLTFDDEIRLDLYYIEHWSPLLDIVILFKTPFAVLKRRKSL